MDDQQYKAMVDSADFFNKSARKLVATERGLHAETLISSVARMAGSLMYRSFGFDEKIESGTAVLSDQANIHGPKLMNVMFMTLQQLGHQIGEANISGEDASAKLSQFSFQETHERLAPFFLKYCEVTPTPFQDAAFGAAMATGILIHDCREVLDVKKGAAIAVYGFVEGTKTSPYPLPNASTSSTKTEQTPAKKPWYKVW